MSQNCLPCKEDTLVRRTFEMWSWKTWVCSARISSVLLVEDTVGFKHVDDHVTNVMVTWIGDVVEQTFKELLGCSDVTDRFDQMETSTSTIEAKTVPFFGGAQDFRQSLPRSGLCWHIKLNWEKTEITRR